MTATVFGPDEIILLLGAGASVEAEIPDSSNMVSEIENLVSSDDGKWCRFRDLYRYIRSSIFYSEGLKGFFGENVPFNIERLVDVLDELDKKEGHTLYPFVGAWNPKLLDVAGAGFSKIGEFRSEIIHILRHRWIPLAENERAAYYKGLLRFQNEYHYPLRVFSLNYDLCVEEACGREKVRRGFSGEERVWDWRLFDETSDDPVPILLYKLHGSLDWGFQEAGRVKYYDSPSTIKDDQVALIFGTSYKLQYVDPFLYLAYELRRWTLDAVRVIVCIGYGFNDDHINRILEQSLRQNRRRKLLAVVRRGDEAIVASEKRRILNQLNAEGDQVEIRACGAKNFLDSGLCIESLARVFPDDDEDPIADLAEV